MSESISRRVAARAALASPYNSARPAPNAATAERRSLYLSPTLSLALRPPPPFSLFIFLASVSSRLVWMHPLETPITEAAAERGESPPVMRILRVVRGAVGE